MPPDDFSRWIAPSRARMTDCIWRIVRNSADVDDVLQEVLVYVWRRFDQLRSHPNPTALLMRLCTQRSLDHLRRHRTRRSLLERVTAVFVARPATPRQTLAASEEHGRLREFMTQLPPREAEAMTLHALEQFDYAEVAVAMGCTESTVRVLINRARARFRTAFEPAQRPAVERADFDTPSAPAARGDAPAAPLSPD